MLHVTGLIVPHTEKKPHCVPAWAAVDGTDTGMYLCSELTFQLSHCNLVLQDFCWRTNNSKCKITSKAQDKFSQYFFVSALYTVKVRDWT